MPSASRTCRHSSQVKVNLPHIWLAFGLLRSSRLIVFKVYRRHRRTRGVRAHRRLFISSARHAEMAARLFHPALSACHVSCSTGIDQSLNNEAHVTLHLFISSRKRLF